MYVAARPWAVAAAVVFLAGVAAATASLLDEVERIFHVAYTVFTCAKQRAAHLLEQQ